jgi:NADPH:quinone reductase-like Zn-dependent oxidoreductase
MDLPKTTYSWVVKGRNGFDDLVCHEKKELPPITDHDVMVKFHAASLNYRDLIIPLV